MPPVAFMCYVRRPAPCLLRDIHDIVFRFPRMPTPFAACGQPASRTLLIPVAGSVIATAVGLPR